MIQLNSENNSKNKLHNKIIQDPNQTKKKKQPKNKQDSDHRKEKKLGESSTAMSPADWSAEMRAGLRRPGAVEGKREEYTVVSQDRL